MNDKNINKIKKIKEKLTITTIRINLVNQVFTKRWSLWLGF